MATPVYVRRSGKVRAILEVNKEWLSFMRPADRNNLLRSSALRAVYDWRYTMARTRFETSVRGAPFGYQGKSKTPMIATGKMRNEVLNKGKPVARAKTDATGTQQLTITYASVYGHIVGKEIARVMKILPEKENQFVADRMAFHISNEKGKLQAVQTGRKSPPRFSLKATADQRRRFRTTIKTAGAVRLRQRKAKP